MKGMHLMIVSLWDEKKFGVIDTLVCVHQPLHTQGAKNKTNTCSNILTI